MQHEGRDSRGLSKIAEGEGNLPRQRGDIMKQIETVIHKCRLQEVRNALDEMGVVDFMESSISCHEDRTKGRVMTFRGARFVANVVEKVKLEIISADDAAEKIIKAIRAIVEGGSREDCRIAMRPYPEVT